MYKQKQPIVLASKSPRRQELMKLMGLDFVIELKETDESYPKNLTPSEISIHIAEQKAKAFDNVEGKIVITADTIVALNGEILGKPTSRNDAEQMLQKLSGSQHEVYTGVSIMKDNVIQSFYDLTMVTCRPVTAEEIAYYIDNFQPFDKAGSYGIQDWWGLAVVKQINGSYTNVMGLPTEKLYSALEKM